MTIKKHGLIMTGNQRDKIIAKIEAHYDRTDVKAALGIEGIIIEESGAPGSYETFYITVYPDGYTDGLTENEPIVIRYSDHKSSSYNEYQLWNDDYSSVTQLYDAIDAIIKERMHCPDTTSSLSFASDTTPHGWEIVLDD